MSADKPFICVNCGAPAAALFKTYGPSVTKLTKCKYCKNVVDKYIEYDPVIVMIDIVLLSREAQRHVIYNTEFKSYWKLLIILVMLETYGVWRNDSLFNIVITMMCGFENNNTSIESYKLPFAVNVHVPHSLLANCWAWDQEERGDDSDLFIWEKDFYIQFISTFAGIAVFIFIVVSFMKLEKLFTRVNEVPLTRLLKSFTLASVLTVFVLPMLVWGGDAAGRTEWGADAAGRTRARHYQLVALYSVTMLACVIRVLYECRLSTSILVVLAANCAKYATSFHVTPLLRTFIT